MKLGTRARYLLCLFGLSGAFVLLSGLLCWVLAIRGFDLGRERIATLAYESLSAVDTRERLIDRLRQLEVMIDAVGIVRQGFRISAADDRGTVLLSIGEARVDSFSRRFPMPNLPGVTLEVGLDRFGRSSRIVLAVVFAFGGWVMIGCALISLTLILVYFRSRAAESHRVFSEILGGNLKARFRTGAFDDTARLMLLFNRMVDEIEQLVSRLKDAETQRTKVLQEISHDTRTPLTSARTSLEMIHDHYQELEDRERRRCIEIALHEVLYLHQLIEDLFFIAEMEEPRSASVAAAVDLREIVAEEIGKRRAAGGIEWKFVDDNSVRALIHGSRPLLVRLLRNAFDNAAKYAKTTVEVRLAHPSAREVSLVIENDGERVAEEIVQKFGIRRPFQKRTGTLAGGQSLGLGSVIMHKIASLHDGQVRFAAKESGGARLELIVKTAA